MHVMHNMHIVHVMHIMHIFHIIHIMHTMHIMHVAPNQAWRPTGESIGRQNAFCVFGTALVINPTYSSIFQLIPHFSSLLL